MVRPMDKSNTPDNPRLVGEDELHALVDGRLTAAQAAEIQSRVDRDEVASRLLSDWRAQRQALRGMHAQMLNEPVPTSFIQAADEIVRSRERARQRWQWGGLAASVALSFALGWILNGVVTSREAVTLAAGSSARSFAQQASLAHMVYLPEVRHPVEVPAAQQEHLVQWLSKRLGRPLKVPVLNTQGFELVGGRLLPGEDGARAQFMYQNTAGERLTLYIGMVKSSSGSGGPAAQTAFRFEDGPVPSFYWVDQGFGYALSGRLNRESLLRLANLVYPQL